MAFVGSELEQLELVCVCGEWEDGERVKGRGEGGGERYLCLFLCLCLYACMGTCEKILRVKKKGGGDELQ